MKVFLFLNDCVLGENTTMEILFAYLKNSHWKDFFLSKNKKDLLNKNFSLVNFNNLFLRKEVINWVEEKTSEEDIVYIISDLPHIPIELLELERKTEILTYEKYHSIINENNEDKIVVTGEIFQNYKYFFNCKKVLYVGPYLVGKFVNVLTVGRTEIIERPYGIFTVFWEYIFNFFANLDILWVLLFFLPSTNFDRWVKVFIIGSILRGISTLWRHLLELEEERKYLVDGKEVLMGGLFIQAHYSTYANLLMSLILFFGIIFYCLITLEISTLIYGLLYGFINFLFITRTFKEKILSRIFSLFFLTFIVQPSFLYELLKIKFGKI